MSGHICQMNAAAMLQICINVALLAWLGVNEKLHDAEGTEELTRQGCRVNEVSCDANVVYPKQQK